MKWTLCLAAMATAWTGSVWAAEPKLSQANQWAQWRGPQTSGHAPHATPPLEWGPNKNVRWKVALPGKGSSTPIVWGEKVFVLAAVPTEQRRPNAGAAKPEDQDQPRSSNRRGRGRFGRSTAPDRVHQFMVLCFDRKTGKKLWEQTALEAVPHEGTHGTNNHAPASPATDGKHLYVSFGSNGIYCYDLDGQLKWKKQLGKMRTRNSFGEGGSPMLHGQTLVVPWDHEGASFITALDTQTGKTLWKTDRDEPTTWATPLVVEYKGRHQVITNGTKRVRSYDLATGKLIWACGGQATNPIPTPLLYGDMVICMTGYRGYAIYAIPIGAKGDITGTDKVVWKRTDSAPYVASPVLVDNQLYFTKSRSGTLSAVDALTGKVLIEQTRLPGIDSIYASPVAAGEHIFFTGRSGTTVVLKHGNKLQVVATNKLDEGIDASFALVGKQLFIRGERHLYCIEKP